jgi:hypothetical protein
VILRWLRRRRLRRQIESDEYVVVEDETQSKVVVYPAGTFSMHGGAEGYFSDVEGCRVVQDIREVQV